MAQFFFGAARQRWAGLALLGVVLAWAAPAAAQTRPGPPTARYWVTLRDKTGVAFDPGTYFAPAAQARRARQHLPAAEATDWPVRPDYLAPIRAGVDTVTLVSRWFNAVAVRATASQAAALRQLPGVAAVALWPLPERAAGGLAAKAGKPRNFSTSPPALNTNDLLLARRQVAHLGGPALARAGLEGQGIKIAVFDVGFEGLPQHAAFARLVQQGRIKATHDFLRNGPDVFRHGSHGTEVMGCLAGYLPGGAALGLAPAADYYLARTERQRRETMGEEEAWLAAAEWADRLGVDVINSSLAYTEQRYFPEQMDGRRSLIARAANLAARKGMLVVSAAGNDGDDDWVRIGTPADADSALAIGGLDPETGLHVEFSSVGPTADRRLKPNLSAFGIVVSTVPGGGYERLEGTSFAAPLVAGLAACAWQRQRGLTAMQLFRALEQSAELYPYFDYAHGYGRPQSSFFMQEATTVAAALAAGAPAGAVGQPTFDFVAHDSLVAVVLRPEAALRPAQALPLLAELPEAALIAVAPESEAGRLPSTPATPAAAPTPAPVGKEKPAAPSLKPNPTPPEQVLQVPSLPSPQPPITFIPEPDFPPYLYWAIADRRGTLRRYEARAVSQRLVVQVPRRLLRGGDVLRVHFKGFTATYAE